ncbi:hypothetical protein CLAIMM_11289 [Cladophialophora immunda]|nr:hypothetical protein CLAIMM_11289 [Cladophialophora immunda]
MEVRSSALNPAGLAAKVQNLIEETKTSIETSGQLPAHLDSSNPDIKVEELAFALQDHKAKPVITSHAYLGARGLVAALEGGADIVIAGRLANALIAGHLIQCSAYATAANFAGFDQYDLDLLMDLPFGIAEVDSDGTAVTTKQENTKGIVTVDTIKCQFLYEIQSAIYLNSDVSADTPEICLEDVGTNRVRMSGIIGHPPPLTTKLAVFYDAGYQCQLLANAAGHATEKKWQLFEKQMRYGLKNRGVLDQFDNLEFQVVGTPEYNPRSQLRSTSYCRVFAQASTRSPVDAIFPVWADKGLHWSLNYRTEHARPYISFYPGLYEQNRLRERACILGSNGQVQKTADVKLPTKYFNLERRINFDSDPVVLQNPQSPTTSVVLGDIVYGRSGDKGANCNFGIYPRNPAHWNWFKDYMSRAKMQELIGDDWRDEYWIERMEFAQIHAVHFVIYGILERGVLASTLLDSLGKGFTDYIRAKVVDVPAEILEQR